MRKLKSLDWTSIIIESIFLVLSILFALGINEYRENNSKEQLRINTIEIIKGELNNNLKELDKLILNHKIKSNNLNELLNTSKDEYFLKKTAIKIIQSLKGSILERPSLSKTAWDSAKITNGINLLNFKTVQSLSYVYDMQENSVEKIWEILAEHLLSKEMFDDKDTRQNLIVFQIYISELYKQEEYLKKIIKEELNEL